MVVHKVKYFPFMKGTYGTHNLTKLTSYLNVKFAEPGHMRIFFVNQSIIKIVVTSVTHKHHPNL